MGAAKNPEAKWAKFAATIAARRAAREQLQKCGVLISLPTGQHACTETVPCSIHGEAR